MQCDYKIPCNVCMQLIQFAADLLLPSAICYQLIYPLGRGIHKNANATCRHELLLSFHMDIAVVAGAAIIAAAVTVTLAVAVAVLYRYT